MFTSKRPEKKIQLKSSSLSCIFDEEVTKTDETNKIKFLMGCDEAYVPDKHPESVSSVTEVMM